MVATQQRYTMFDFLKGALVLIALLLITTFEIIPEEIQDLIAAISTITLLPYIIYKFFKK